MKTLFMLILSGALAGFAFAQRAQNNTDEKLRARNAPDVFIYSASAFGPDKNGESHFTIEVGNMGAKTIIGIEWEYDPGFEGAGYDARFASSFHNQTPKLLPNERRKLTQQVHRYSDKFVAGFHLDTVQILRVDYEDGSSWQRTANN